MGMDLPDEVIDTACAQQIMADNLRKRGYKGQGSLGDDPTSSKCLFKMLREGLTARMPAELMGEV